MAVSQIRNRKTPGVYVTEIPAFPPSVVGVPTAIPIFIGYTEKAEVGGKSVIRKPVRIESLADYEYVFGKGFSGRYSLQLAPKGSDQYDFRAWSADPESPGWQAYRLVVAGAPAADASGSTTPATDASGSTKPATDASEPAKPAADASVTASPPPAPSGDSGDGSAVSLEEPAAPLPPFNLYNSMRLFYDNGGATCYVVSVGAYTDPADPTQTPKPVEAKALLDGLEVAGAQAGPTMIVVPDAVLLPAGTDNPWESDDFTKVARKMLTQASTLQDRIAILDVYGAQYANTSDHPTATLDAVITAFRTAVGDNGASNGESYLSYGAAYFPFLHTTVIPLSDVTYQNIDDSNGLLAKILTWENQRLYPAPSTGNGAAAVPLTSSETVTGSGTAPKAGTASGAGLSPVADTSPPADTSPAASSGTVALSARGIAVQEFITKMADKTLTVDQVSQLNNNLVAALPVLKVIEQQVIARNNVLPPSAAMAGVYTSVDAVSGVWNAPANVSLNSVDRPTLKLNSTQQEDLNLPVDGKAVDALRSFPGRGTVVWGARTLDGNSPDYRYVQVRRTLLYLEQSIKAALEPFVFAPNTGQTWATVTSMVSGFLTGVWSRGGLMGAKASDAFTVSCGLGSTMTGQDVLDGYMIVQVTLSLIRPAEFIELTFKQTMQGVG